MAKELKGNNEDNPQAAMMALATQLHQQAKREKRLSRQLVRHATHGAPAAARTTRHPTC